MAYHSAAPWVLLLGISAAGGALAQGVQPQPQVARQASQEWQTMTRMELERQFAGPLRDTIIQRWRDPSDGTICYVYLPITAAHSNPTETGFVQYGANNIGSISCMSAAETKATASPAPPSNAARPVVSPSRTVPTPLPIVPERR